MKLYFLATITFLGLTTGCAWRLESTPRLELPPKLASGLIGSDYGILSRVDLENHALNDGSIAPLEASPRSNAQAYWMCFPRQAMTLGCEVSDPVEHTDGLDVEARDSEGTRHIYIFRRGDIECAPFMKDWKPLLEGQSHVCLAGFPNPLERDTKGHFERYWIFDKLKTKRGCDVFFGDCAR